MTATSTKTLPRWTSVWSRICLVAGVFCLGIGGWFLLSPGEGGGDGAGHDLAVALGLYITGFVVVSVPVSMVMVAPFERLRRQLDAGTAQKDLVVDDVVAALRMPLRVFFAMLVTGIVLAVALIGASFIVPALSSWRTVLGVGSVAVSLIAATTQAYVQHYLVVRRVAPLLVGDGRLDHLGAAPKLRIWHHLLVLSLNMAVAWPAIIVVVVDRGITSTPIAALPLIGLYLVIVAVQVASLLGIVATNVGHLRDRLEEVRSGNLDVKATIFAFDSFGVVMSEFNRMIEGLRQREHLKETFGRYVTKQVADEILAGRVELGGELRTATVLFSDIRGFTTMSERLGPTEVVAFLNEYLTAMVDCVIEHGGVLDKFIGDAVLAVFGAPVGTGSIEQDARAAVACARTMGVRLDEMNARRIVEGRAPINIGIGVHTGELVAGNIGSPKRMQYTVIGDTVNVGSRLESLTKEHHRRTLLSAATVAFLGDSVALVEVGTVTVRGRTEPLVIFGLCDEAPLA